MMEERQHLTTDGVRLGAKLALWLSLLYIGVFLLVLMGPFVGGAGGPPLSWYLITSLVIFGFGVVLGVLPALAIGVITGWLIAFVIERVPATFSRRVACVIGLFISGGIAIALNLLLYPKEPLEIEAYQRYVAIPSIVYILASGYMGIRIHMKRHSNNDKTLAVNARL